MVGVSGTRPSECLGDTSRYFAIIKSCLFFLLKPLAAWYSVPLRQWSCNYSVSLQIPQAPKQEWKEQKKQKNGRQRDRTHLGSRRVGKLALKVLCRWAEGKPRRVKWSDADHSALIPEDYGHVISQHFVGPCGRTVSNGMCRRYSTVSMCRRIHFTVRTTHGLDHP